MRKELCPKFTISGQLTNKSRRPEKVQNRKSTYEYIDLWKIYPLKIPRAKNHDPSPRTRDKGTKGIEKGLEGMTTTQVSCYYLSQDLMHAVVLAACLRLR